MIVLMKVLMYLGHVLSCLIIKMTYTYWWNQIVQCLGKLEQLECLRSEDTPRRLMITHIIESYWIPSQKKTMSKLQI